MEICGQYFSRETLRRIEGELEREPGLSRRALARRVWRLIWWRRTRRVRVELAEFASWRIYALVKQGRETPDLPCDVYLAEEEWKVLYA